MSPLTVIAWGSVRPAVEPSWDRDLPAAQKRRNPRIWQMASLAVARLALNCAGKPRSIVVATALGALDETTGFIDGVYTANAGAPRNFIASVHNSMAGKLALDGMITGPNLTVCDGHNSLASALVAADMLSDADFPALVVAVDETTALLSRLRPHLSAQCQSYLSDHREEGAVAFLCTRGGVGPRIEAIGPLPVASEAGVFSCRSLAQPFLDAGYALIDTEEGATSYLHTACSLESVLNSSKPGERYVVGSFSPAARAAALVTICA
jgi:hypothetical protein